MLEVGELGQGNATVVKLGSCLARFPLAFMFEKAFAV